MTALQAIHLVGEYHPSKVKSVLWHAGASSVSLAGVQLCKNLSDPPPKIFATARQDSKCDFLVKEMGVDVAINSTLSYAKADGSDGGDWADEILRSNNNQGVDLVIDFVGAPYFASNLKVLARDGRVVQLGVMGGTVLPAEVDISAFVMKRVSFCGSTLRSRDPDYQEKLRDLFVERVVPGLVKGVYKPNVEHVLSWREIGRAHRLLEENKTRGKIVCLVDQDV